MRVKLLNDPPSGLVRNEDHELIVTHPFIGQIGEVQEEDDTGYDAQQPTGYEPVMYLIDFGSQKLWIPSSTFLGGDLEGKEHWSRHLEFIRS